MNTQYGYQSQSPQYQQGYAAAGGQPMYLGTNAQHQTGYHPDQAGFHPAGHPGQTIRLGNDNPQPVLTTDNTGQQWVTSVDPYTGRATYHPYHPQTTAVPVQRVANATFPSFQNNMQVPSSRLPQGALVETERALNGPRSKHDASVVCGCGPLGGFFVLLSTSGAGMLAAGLGIGIAVTMGLGLLIGGVAVLAIVIGLVACIVLCGCCSNNPQDVGENSTVPYHGYASIPTEYAAAN